MGESEKKALLEEALRRLKENGARSEGPPLKDVPEIIHELQVHQIELEIQNEELRKTQEQLTASRDRFLRLFHSAPVGYAIIDEHGMIIEANETLCRMVGREFEKLRATAFSELLSDEGKKIFLGRFRALFKEPGDKIILVEMISSSGAAIPIRIEGTHFADDRPGKHGNHLLITVSDITAFKRSEAELLKRQKRNDALLKASRAVLESREFLHAARIIFDICKELTGATSGYVALLSSDGMENEVVFLDSGGLPCAVDPSLPMPLRGLREVTCRERRAVYDNDFLHSRWMEFIPAGHVALENVLFAPLILQGKAVGLIGLANKKGGFSEEDVEVAVEFADIAAIALMNSRNIELLESSIKEREILLKELQHRVKNNLAMISGIITLESEHAGDEKLKLLLGKARDRIDTLSKLYDRLYVSADIRSVRLDEFLSQVIHSLVSSLAGSGIRLEMNIEPVAVSTKNATAWGLIVNELVTNSLKYAFSDTNSGVLTVKLSRVNESIILVISDDGTKSSPDLNKDVPKGFGTLLVELLVKQLRGSLRFERDNGFMVHIQVPAEKGYLS